MKMISYAQNFEDVILNRAFPDVTDGFYIDIGACHPVYHSVTKSFYEKGWRGINVEPVRACYQLCCDDRPRDINLHLGISNREGTLELYEAPSSVGRSTFTADWTERWNQVDGCEFVATTVAVTTLAKLCEQHVDRAVDFLKIDVEGHEREVLEGADLRRWRPKVMVLEGETTEPWHDLLDAAGYEFATFDGINQYYTSYECRDLIPLLNAPVSLVKDNFVLFEHLTERHGLQVSLEHTQGELAAARGEIQALREQLARFENVGPRSLAVAKRLQHMAHTYPAIRSFARKVVRAK